MDDWAGWLIVAWSILVALGFLSYKHMTDDLIRHLQGLMAWERKTAYHNYLEIGQLIDVDPAVARTIVASMARGMETRDLELRPTKVEQAD